MKKFWFFNVAGGVALLAAVALNRPATATPTATCAPACKADNTASASLEAVDFGAAGTPTATCAAAKATCAPACGESGTASASLQEMAFSATGTPTAACATTTATCAAACSTVSAPSDCPPIWLLLPRNPVDVFASRVELLDAKLAVDPAQPNNVLVLNGKAFDFDKLSKVMQGPLELMEGTPDAPDSKSIPFTAYLIRNGKVVKKGVSNPDQSVLLLDSYKMLKLAQPGDELQILPSCRSGKPLNFCLSGGC